MPLSLTAPYAQAPAPSLYTNHHHSLLRVPLDPLKAMATRQAHRPASDGSRTITVQDNQPREEGQTDGESSTVGTLRLRGVARRRQRVVWREDVVDNEGAGKKSSKGEQAQSGYLAVLT